MSRAHIPLRVSPARKLSICTVGNQRVYCFAILIGMSARERIGDHTSAHLILPVCCLARCCSRSQMHLKQEQIRVAAGCQKIVETQKIIA